MIWKGRCATVVEHEVLVPEQVVYRSKKAIGEFELANFIDDKRKTIEKTACNKEQLWSKPADGWVKVNSDGSYCSKSGKAGIGFVVRDQNGYVLEAVGKSISSSCALNVETLALR